MMKLGMMQEQVSVQVHPQVKRVRFSRGLRRPCAAFAPGRGSAQFQLARNRHESVGASFGILAMTQLPSGRDGDMLAAACSTGTAACPSVFSF